MLGVGADERIHLSMTVYYRIGCLSSTIHARWATTATRETVKGDHYIITTSPLSFLPLRISDSPQNTDLTGSNTYALVVLNIEGKNPCLRHIDEYAGVEEMRERNKGQL